MENKSQSIFSTIKKHWAFFLLLIASIFVRTLGLGYSHFYGDETKTFYLDKTIPAIKFLLNQRKGPFQFLVVWFMEKVTGGYDELFTRIPFAIAGILSIVVFYLLINSMFKNRVALLATALFSFSGFSIAFSRTIQYQSFLMLFGLLGILFSYMYFAEDKFPNRRKLFLLGSSISLGLAFLCHYDALFFAIPAVVLIFERMLLEKYVHNYSKELIKILLYFILPIILMLVPFYLPYILGGYFTDQTQNYIERRAVGASFAPNHSGYTFWVYNPNILWMFVPIFLFPCFYIKDAQNFKLRVILLWFLSSFIVFELFFSNPGTHINNYFIPLFILISLGAVRVLNLFTSNITKKSYVLLLITIVVSIMATSYKTFIPSLNTGYPWSGNVVNKKFHLFLYGFPYNRGWDQISNYFSTLEGVRGVYTNDNDTVAQYYLYGLDYTPPGVNFLPQYYVHVFNNQEFNTTELIDISQYTKQKEFYVDGVLSSVVYKRK